METVIPSILPLILHSYLIIARLTAGMFPNSPLFCYDIIFQETKQGEELIWK